nr:ABC transporter substrate-binding protein [Staphylococcus hominis]
MPVYSAIYQPLVTYGENGKDYTFHLKHNIKFNDGSTFNAKAVKFSYG